MNAQLSWSNIFFVILVMLISVAACGQTPSLAPEEIYKQALPSVMVLDIVTKEGLKTSANAFLTSKEGVAATVLHILRNAQSVTAKFSTGEEFDVSGLVDKDEQRNLALVRVKVAGRPLLPLETTEPVVGCKVYVLATAQGSLNPSFAEGMLSQITTEENVKYYQFSCQMSLDRSGGPLLDSGGKVLGVVALRTQEEKTVSLAIPSVYLAGLDNTLPTIPWEEVKWDTDNAGEPAANVLDTIDQVLARALAVDCDFLTGYNYAEMQISGVGYLRGVPDIFYQFRQKVESQVSAVSACRTNDPLRQRLVQRTANRLISDLKAADLYINAVVSAPASNWGAQSRDQLQRSRAMLKVIWESDEYADFIVDLKQLAASSKVFSDTLPAEARYALGLSKRESGIRLGCRVLTYQPLMCFIVTKGGLADKIGLRPGDKVMSVADHVFDASAGLEPFKCLIKENLGKKMSVVVVRGGKEQKITLNIPSQIPADAVIPE